MMRRVALGPVGRIGPVAFAAVEETRLHAQAMPGPPLGVAGGGEKRPLALLIAGPGGLIAAGPDGTPMAEAAVEALCPGACARLTRATEA